MVRIALAVSFLATASSFLAPSRFLPTSPQHAKSTLTRRSNGGGHRRRRGAALAVDMSGIVSAIDTFYRTSPLQAAFLTCGVKASCSDAISQKSIEVRFKSHTEAQVLKWQRKDHFVFFVSKSNYDSCQAGSFAGKSVKVLTFESYFARCSSSL